MNNPIVIPPEIQAKIDETQKKQSGDDAIGEQAAGKSLPGALREAFVEVKEIPVGPYKIRRFANADFKRLAQIGHPLNGLSELRKWLDNPDVSSNDCYNLLWIMTRPVEEVKSAIAKGVDELKAAAEKEFDEYGILELSRLTAAVAVQLSRSMGANLEYKSVLPEGHDSPPPASQL